MPNPLMFAAPGNQVSAAKLADELDCVVGLAEFHQFPDGETLVRVKSDCAGKTAIVYCTLDRPDAKLLPLYFLASTLRELGAAGVLLVAPYLAYMRQDRAFHVGEGITARQFARMLSGFVDGLVTVDPHLHRIHSLREVFPLPASVVHAAKHMADWIRANVTNPVLIGPDSESRQWVAEVAKLAHAPFTVLDKVRRGDRDVQVSLPDMDRWRDHTPVLVDDIISTGRTMMAAVGQLKRDGTENAVCVGVHAVFAQNAYAELMRAGAVRVATSNSVTHESNAFELHTLIAPAVREVLEQLA